MIRKSALSVVALIAVLLVGGAYLLVGIAKVKPWDSQYTLMVSVPASGGLLDTSPVLVRGVPVGRVTHIGVSARKLEIRMSINSDKGIPRNSRLNIQNLSIAGEQYVNFVPESDDGDLYRNGDVIPEDLVHVSTSIPEGLPKLAQVADALDSDSIDQLNTTIAEAVNGRDADLQLIGDMSLRMAEFVSRDGSLRVAADNAEFILGLMSTADAGDVLSTASVRTPAAVDGLARIQRAFINFTTGSYDKWPPILTLVEKLSGYIQVLQPEIVTITRAVKPSTARISDTYIDFASISDLLSRAFPQHAPGRAVLPLEVIPEN